MRIRYVNVTFKFVIIRNLRIFFNHFKTLNICIFAHFQLILDNFKYKTFLEIKMPKLIQFIWKTTTTKISKIIVRLNPFSKKKEQFFYKENLNLDMSFWSLGLNIIEKKT